MSNPLADAVEGVIKALIGAPGQIDEAQRERLIAGLDECRRVLTAIGPNAPTIRAAVERRLAEIERKEQAVRDATTSPVVLAERSGIAQRPYGCAECGTAIALVGDPMPAVGTRCTRCEAQARTERGDEPTRETPTVSTVSINGVPMAVQIGAPLTYEAIVDEMGRRGKRGGLYTVAWSMPRGPSGALSPGQSVVAQIGMRVSAVLTDGA